MFFSELIRLFSFVLQVWQLETKTVKRTRKGRHGNLLLKNLDMRNISVPIISRPFLIPRNIVSYTAYLLLCLNSHLLYALDETAVSGPNRFRELSSFSTACGLPIPCELLCCRSPPSVTIYRSFHRITQCYTATEPHKLIWRKIISWI